MRYLCLLIFFVSACSGGKKDTNRSSFSSGPGIVSGVIRDPYGFAVTDADISIDIKGKKTATTTTSDGTFSLTLPEVRQYEGYNLLISAGSRFQSSARAAIFELPNLRVDVGTVTLPLVTDSVTRTVTGTVLDDFTASSLSGVAVYTTDASGQVITGTTDAGGVFILTSNSFPLTATFVIHLQKAGYISSSSVYASIADTANTINGNPVRLYKAYGSIVGKILDDATSTGLASATAQITDSLGSVIATATNATGDFTLSGQNILVGNSYNVSISKTAYNSAQTAVYILTSANNTIAQNPLHLLNLVDITGTITPISSGVTVTASDSNGNNVQIITTTSAFTLSSAGFKRGQTYQISFSHPAYELKTVSAAIAVNGSGANLGSIPLTAKGGSQTITGSVTDAYDGRSVAATISVVDQGSALRTVTADSTGAFSLSGNFSNNTAYNFSVTHPDYTGNTAVTEVRSVTYLNPSPFQITLPFSLYPLGIKFRANGVLKECTQARLQNVDNFLTDKIGFTYSARSTNTMTTAGSCYVHTDYRSSDLYAKPLPALPVGSFGLKSANSIGINGARKKGYIAEKIWGTTDTRPATWNMTGAVGYYFYAANTGSFTVETYGSTDTVLTLYGSTGTQLTSDNNTGTATGTGGNNAKINNFSLAAAGWYFIKVSGATGAIFGFFDIDVKGPNQTNGQTGTGATAGLNQYSLNDLVLSWYDKSTRTMYIAGNGESASSGVVDISTMGRVGDLFRGSFSGAMRAVDATGNTINITNGYFNDIRKE
jgi:hypothetical protein